MVLAGVESDVRASAVLAGAAVVVPVVLSEVAPVSAEAFFAERFEAAARGGVFASCSEGAASGLGVVAGAFVA